MTASDIAVPNLAERVRRERVRLMFERSRRSNLVAPFGALLVVWLMWPVTDHRLLGAWLLARLVIAALRFTVDRRARRDDAARLPSWGRRYEGLLCADGFAWGMLGWALLPAHSPQLGAAVSAALVGIAAISMVLLSASWRPNLLYTLPLLVPSIVRLLAEGDRVSLFLGLGMALFMLLLVMEVRRVAEHTAGMLNAHFQMDELVAARQAALEQALRSDAAKGQFLATISHEVRTPLHGMLGLARQLAHDSATNPHPEPSHALHTLLQAGEHLLELVNNVLDYATLDAGQLRLVARDFDLRALLRELHALTQQSARERGLELHLRCAPDAACWLRGDALRLRQVLLNLLGNAIKFTDTGSVTLHARHARDPLRAGHVALSIDVIDTGPGVPADDRERIFDAFHQLDASFARRRGGAGLGLSISRELARALGGELSCVDGEPPGATFRLQLSWPAGDATTAAAAAAAAPASSSSTPTAPMPPVMQAGLRPESVAAAAPLRVLLAEDNDVNALVASLMLERAGAQVVRARDGHEAVAQARTYAHDLILMDCQMPGLDGFAATASIRADERSSGRPRTRIVALTANALAGDRERCLAAGMDDHLSKPFDAAQLTAVLRTGGAVAPPPR